jgi:hypothetical protein
MKHTRWHTRWRYLKKKINYEYDFLRKKFRLSQIFIFLISLIALVITGYNDTISFFIGSDSPIPKEWAILKNPKLATILTVSIIAIPYIFVWAADYRNKSREVSDLSVAIQENLVPSVEFKLSKLAKTIKSKFHLDDSIRLSIFVPVRVAFMEWRLQMVCHTSNISVGESQVSLKLDESVVGYTFLKTKKLNIEIIDLSDKAKLPHSFIPLRRENSILVKRDIKAALVIAAFQEGSIAGLLLIDTNNLTNLHKMEDNALHEYALDWIIGTSGAIKFLWRMKNNV